MSHSYRQDPRNSAYSGTLWTYDCGGVSGRNQVEAVFFMDVTSFLLSLREVRGRRKEFEARDLYW
jgi:hypothetical protein